MNSGVTTTQCFLNKLGVATIGTVDQNGYEFPSDFIKKDEVYVRQTVNCLSSSALDLGTCRCVSHDPWGVVPCSIELLHEHGIVLKGKELLTQLLALANTNIGELEEFCRLSYKFGSNPLPKLREMLPGIPVQFMYQNSNRTMGWSPEQFEVVVELCNDNESSPEVWIEIYE